MTQYNADSAQLIKLRAKKDVDDAQPIETV